MAATNLFQQIWNADPNKADLDWSNGIPDFPADLAETESYQRVAAFFDNYDPAQTHRETETTLEDGEKGALISYVMGTECMKIVQQHMGFDVGEMQAHLMGLWFGFFNLGQNKDLSLFEHIVIGETRGFQVTGQHFWFTFLHFYHQIPSTTDLQTFAITDFEETNSTSDVLTCRYKWVINDEPFEQGVGGFFLNCSIECFMAIYTLREFLTHSQSLPINLNGRDYQLILYINSGHARTIFPQIV